MFYCPDRDGFMGYKYEAADWPQTGYFNWGGDWFPNGERTRYPVAYATKPFMWFNAYFPLAQDIMRGFVADDALGNIDDANGRVAHIVNGMMTRSNAVRHDGSVSSTEYVHANALGWIEFTSSMMYHLVDPEPFAPISGGVSTGVEP